MRQPRRAAPALPRSAPRRRPAMPRASAASRRRRRRSSSALPPPQTSSSADDERERAAASPRTPGSSGAKNHARPASKAVPMKLMHQREVRMSIAGVTDCSVLAVQHDLDPPVLLAALGVVLGAIGSASARPSAADPRRVAESRAMMAAHGAGARGGELEVRREAHGVDRLVVGVVDHLQRSASRCAGPRRSARSSGSDAGRHVRAAGLNIERSVMRTTGVAGVPSRLTRSSVDLRLQAGAQPIEHRRLGWRRRRWQRLHDRRAGHLRHVRRRCGEHLGLQAHRRPRSDWRMSRTNRPPHSATARGQRDPDRHAAAVAVWCGTTTPRQRRDSSGAAAWRCARDRRRALSVRSLLEFALAARLPVAAHEAERQADVHQLDDGQERCRVLQHLAELIEELVGAARAVMEGSPPVSGSPSPLAAPQGVFSTTSSMLAHSA